MVITSQAATALKAEQTPSIIRLAREEEEQRKQMTITAVTAQTVIWRGGSGSAGSGEQQLQTATSDVSTEDDGGDVSPGASS